MHPDRGVTPDTLCKEIETSKEPLPQLLRRLATDSLQGKSTLRGGPTAHLLRVLAARIERENGGRR